MDNKKHEKDKFKNKAIYRMKCINCDFSKYIALSASAKYPEDRKCPVCGTLYPLRLIRIRLNTEEEINEENNLITDAFRRPGDIIGYMECAKCGVRFDTNILNNLINESIKGEHVDCPVCHDNRLFVKIDFNELVKVIQGGR